MKGRGNRGHQKKEILNYIGRKEGNNNKYSVYDCQMSDMTKWAVHRGYPTVLVLLKSTRNVISFVCDCLLI